MTTPIYRKTQRSSRALPDWTQSSPGPQASTTFWDNLQFSWPHSILPKTQDKRKHPDDEDAGCLCHNYKFKTQTMRRKKKFNINRTVNTGTLREFKPLVLSTGVTKATKLNFRNLQAEDVWAMQGLWQTSYWQMLITNKITMEIQRNVPTLGWQAACLSGNWVYSCYKTAWWLAKTTVLLKVLVNLRTICI